MSASARIRRCVSVILSRIPATVVELSGLNSSTFAKRARSVTISALILRIPRPCSSVSKNSSLKLNCAGKVPGTMPRRLSVTSCRAPRIPRRREDVLLIECAAAAKTTCPQFDLLGPIRKDRCVARANFGSDFPELCRQGIEPAECDFICHVQPLTLRVRVRLRRACERP